MSFRCPPNSDCDEGVTGDLDDVVRDLVAVADLGVRQDPPIRFAYENLAWGTSIDRWEGLWEVVKRGIR